MDQSKLRREIKVSRRSKGRVKRAIVSADRFALRIWKRMLVSRAGH